MSNCKIELDSFQETYYAGSTIRGRVISYSRHRGVHAKLRGEENIHNYFSSWEGRSRNPEPSKSYNKFLSVEHYLQRVGVIENDRSEYPFTFTLPKDIPGSYRSSQSNIVYSIKAFVEEAYEDIHILEITVVAPIDLNKFKYTALAEPLTFSNIQKPCHIPHAGGPIIMEARLRKQAFAVGETARVNVKVTNMSDVRIKDVEVKIGMTTELKLNPSSGQSRYEYNQVVSDKGPGVTEHHHRDYQFGLKIPATVVVPNFELCKLHSCRFWIRVTASLPHMHKDVEISSTIALGHIPKRETEDLEKDEKDTVETKFGNQCPLDDYSSSEGTSSSTTVPSHPPPKYHPVDLSVPSSGQFPSQPFGSYVLVPVSEYPSGIPPKGYVSVMTSGNTLFPVPSSAFCPSAPTLSTTSEPSAPPEPSAGFDHLSGFDSAPPSYDEVMRSVVKKK